MREKKKITRQDIGIILSVIGLIVCILIVVINYLSGVQEIIWYWLIICEIFCLISCLRGKAKAKKAAAKKQSDEEDW